MIEETPQRKEILKRWRKRRLDAEAAAEQTGILAPVESPPPRQMDLFTDQALSSSGKTPTMPA